MKNIFVLPTDKPSRLVIDTIENKLYYQPILHNKTVNVLTQHIYITSDDKFVKDEYITDGIEVIQASSKLVNAQGLVNRRNWRKIILTTDQDLIKDGVQAIDDEFLEWFVQNPSCEEVEVNKMRYGYLSGYADAGYKIIIPKKNFYCGDKFDYDEQCEFQCDTCVDKKGVDYGYLPKEGLSTKLHKGEVVDESYPKEFKQKQALIDMMKSDEELELYDEDSPAYNHQARLVNDLAKEIKLEELFNDDKRENIKIFIDEIKNPSEPNQALKDAFEKYSEYLEDFENKNTYEHGFKDGAKWQQEQDKKLYSEEEVYDLFSEWFLYKSGAILVDEDEIPNGVLSFNQWFEQFKKK